MLAIRLKRIGAKKKPYYRIVVSDSRKTPTSRFVDSIGLYQPLADPPLISIDKEKAEAWVSKGAKMSDTVQSLLAKATAVGSDDTANEEN